MNDFRRVSPGDLEALRMENELLNYEVLHLRARLKGVDRDWQRKLRVAEAKANKHQAKVEELNSKGADQIARLERRIKNRREDLQQARDDICRLLRRLDQSLLGPVFRSRPGFRMLLTRYMTRES